MLKSLVGFPLYHQVPATWFAQWEKMDRQHVAGTLVINGAYITTAMDVMVRMALEMDEPWDRLLVYEHDMIPPPEAITRIANYDPDYDIVGSMYFSHTPPHFPFVYIVNEENGDTDPIAPVTVKDWCDDPMLYEVGAVGFGFTSIARHVLERWNPDSPMFKIDMDAGFGSHDLWFCHQARKQGFRVYVDSGIVCEHLSEFSVGLSYNQDWADKINPENIFQFASS
jgi:hypothetical protein